jgi:hypothetical protein
MTNGLVGGGWTSFLMLTVILFGFAAIMAGQALARRWRPIWQIPFYVLLLAAGDRFLLYALFGGVLLSASGFVLAYLLLLAAALLAYRLTRVHSMLRQYPWLYERAGPFGWRPRDGSIGPANFSKERQP